MPTISFKLEYTVARTVYSLHQILEYIQEILFSVQFLKRNSYSLRKHI